MPRLRAVTDQGAAWGASAGGIPGWILDSPHYAGLAAGVKHTLAVMAGRGEPGPAGIVCFGGAQTVAAVGCARSTWWQHVRLLAALGFLVPLGGAGTFGSSNLPAQWGIPAHPGAMDDRRQARRMRVGGQDIPPGGQAEFPGLAPPSDFRTTPVRFPGARTSPDGHDHEYGASTKQHKHHDHEAPGRPDVDAGRRAAGSTGRRWWRVEPADLGDVGSLHERFAEAVVAGIVTGSEADWLRFVSAAQHALRVGQANPAGLFACMVRRGQWLWISQADEDAAVAAIRKFEAEWE